MKSGVMPTLDDYINVFTHMHDEGMIIPAPNHYYSLSLNIRPTCQSLHDIFLNEQFGGIDRNVEVNIEQMRVIMNFPTMNDEEEDDVELCLRLMLSARRHRGITSDMIFLNRELLFKLMKVIQCLYMTTCWNQAV